MDAFRKRTIKNYQLNRLDSTETVPSLWLELFLPQRYRVQGNIVNELS
jgi:hypothetical protein